MLSPGRTDGACRTRRATPSTRRVARSADLWPLSTGLTSSTGPNASSPGASARSYAHTVSLNQEQFVSLLSELFEQPFEHVVNNDLPLEEPIDVNWGDGTGTCYCLRLYVHADSVLAVSQTAPGTGLPWDHEKRVLVFGDRAVRIAHDVDDLVTSARDG